MSDSQTHLHSDLSKYSWSNYTENESKLAYIVGYIFEMVKGSNSFVDDLRLENMEEAVCCWTPPLH